MQNHPVLEHLNQLFSIYQNQSVAGHRVVRILERLTLCRISNRGSLNLPSGEPASRMRASDRDPMEFVARFATPRRNLNCGDQPRRPSRTVT